MISSHLLRVNYEILRDENYYFPYFAYKDAMHHSKNSWHVNLYILEQLFKIFKVLRMLSSFYEVKTNGTNETTFL